MSDAHVDPDRPGAESGEPSASLWVALLDRVRQAAAPRFEVERLIGYGGMAGVYLASEPKLGRLVAIKVMSPSLMMDPALVQRFRQEARTIAQLSHPNIITIYDVMEDQDLQYFVMAYVPGRTVGHVMRESRGPLPIDVVRAWMYQIGSALDYAHGFGVVHRDVKPGNILLDAQGNALVTDFGIAKVADQEGLTRTGMLVGTPAYMSPEQCASSEVGAASDQYSLGALSYQMLTGEPPFSGPTLAVLHAHVSQRPEPVGSIRPDCPEEMAEAVDRMLAKQPRDRWPSLSGALTAMRATPVGHGAPVRASLVDLASPVETIVVSSPRGVQRHPIPSEPITAGETFMVEAVVSGPNGRALSGRRVNWTSDAPSVARVMSDGRVVALAPGSARIRGECGGVSDALTFQVTEAPGVEPLTPPTREVRAGARIALSRLLPAGVPVASGPDSGWATTRPDVAHVTPTGELVALRPGTATVTAFQGRRAVVADLEVIPEQGEVGALGESRASTPVPVSAAAAARRSAEERSGSGAAADVPRAAGAARPADGDPRPGGLAPGRRPLALAGGAAAVIVLVLGAGVLLMRSGPAGDPAGPTDGLPPVPPPAAAVPDDPDAAAIAADPDAAADPDVAVDPDTADDPDVAADPEVRPETVRVPDPGPPPPADPPRPTEGGVRVAGLPPGARAVLLVEGAQVTIGPGAELSLPPGTYEARVSAEGFEPLEERVTVTAGETIEWRPVLEAEEVPVPDPPTEEDPGPDEAALRAEAVEGVEGLVAAFAEAFGTRDMERVLRFFLEAPGGWAQQWRPLVEDTRNARDLEAEVRDLREIELEEPGRASAAFTIRLQYRDFRNTLQTPELQFRAIVERRDAEWRFRELREGS